MYKLTRYSTTPESAVNNQHQWPIRVAAELTSDSTPAKIFVMQEAAPGEFETDTFSCVASAVQMHDLPEDAPSAEGPFFRVADFTVPARSAEAGTEFFTKVQGAVQDLANNMEAMSTLSAAEEVTITPGIVAGPYQ